MGLYPYNSSSWLRKLPWVLGDNGHSLNLPESQACPQLFGQFLGRGASHDSATKISRSKTRSVCDMYQNKWLQQFPTTT